MITTRSHVDESLMYLGQQQWMLAGVKAKIEELQSGTGDEYTIMCEVLMDMLIPNIDPREKHAHRLRDYIKAVEDEKWLDHLNSYDDFAKALAADTIRGTSEFLQKCRMFLECDIFYYERELRASENKCDG